MHYKSISKGPILFWCRICYTKGPFDTLKRRWSPLSFFLWHRKGVRFNWIADLIELTIWYVIYRWYTSASNRVCVNNQMSDFYSVTRGVKNKDHHYFFCWSLISSWMIFEVSVLVSRCVECLLVQLMLTIFAACKSCITEQYSIISDFTSNNLLKLNFSKTEFIKTSHHFPISPITPPLVLHTQLNV